MATRRKQSRRPFGMVRELPSGRIQASYLSDGQRVNAPQTFTTVEDARAWLSTVETDRLRGTLKARPRVRETLGEYASRWVKQRPGLRESTRRQYGIDLRLHVEPYLGRYALDKVTPDLVRRWYAELGEDLAEQLSETVSKRSSRATVRDGSATQARAYRLLRAIYATAVEDELVDRSPCNLKGAGSVKSSERPVLTDAEVDKLADEVPEHYRALVLLLAWSGLRIGEAAALTVADLVDLRSDTRAAVRVVERTYRVAGRYDSDAPKSSAGVRTVPLPPSILPALRAHVRTHTTREPGALVFTTSTGGNVLGAYGQVLRRALNRIGRDDVRVHDLRHFGMVRAAQTGASLPELMRRMGHGTTQAAETYLGTTEDHGREVAQRMSKQATSRSNVAYLPGVRRQRTGS